MSVRLFLCLLFSHLILSLLFRYYFIRLRNLTFFLHPSLPSLFPPFLKIISLSVSFLVVFFYVFSLPSSFNFSSPSFFNTSVLLFSLLLATQFCSSHFFVLYSSFLPSFPSLFFPLFACLSSASDFLSHFLLYCCLQVYFLFIPLLLTLFFFPFLLLHSFIASLLYSVMSRQNINCAIQLQPPQHH